MPIIRGRWFLGDYVNRIAICGAALLTSGLSVVAASQMPVGGGHGQAPPQAGSQHGTKAPVPDSTGIVPRPATKGGCGAWDIRVAEGGAVAVTVVADPPCGPVQPRIAGTPDFDASSRVVHVPIALENLDIVRLHAPAALVASIGSLIPVGRRPNATILHFVAPDSTAPDSVTRRGPESFWLFDTILRAAGQPPVTAEDGAIVLPPGATSQPRSIAIQMAPGISAFQLSLTTMGTYVFTVPAQPPLHVSMEEMEDSRRPENVIVGDPHFPGRIVRNKLWLLFRAGTTEEQREAAIDLVNGVVIGGTTRGGFGPTRGGDRYYYVRIAANPDSGAAPLGRAIRALAALPQVQDVITDQLSLSGTS